MWLKIHRPLFYCRFIDEIFSILKEKQSLDNLRESFGRLELTGEINDSNSATYLDLKIFLNNLTLCLEFSVFFKKINTFNFLPRTSNHPEFILKNIPKSLFIRIRRICSSFNDILFFSEELTNKFIERGYEKKFFNEVTKMVAKLDRDKLIKYNKKTSNKITMQIPSKLPFDKNILKFNFLLQKSFNDSNLSNALNTGKKKIC